MAVAKFRSKEQEEIVRETLSLKPLITGGFFTLLIFTLSLFRYFTLVLLLWSCLCGIGLAYFILCKYPSIPNLLFMYKPREKTNDDDPSSSQSLHICTVCNQLKCQRHRPSVIDIDLEPWKNLKINQAVDDAIQEFLDLLLENYVYHWYREKLSTDERFVDELRKTLRFIFAVILRRLKKIDLPSLILDKLVSKTFQHLESYLKVRRKTNNDFTNIQVLMFDELGDNLHSAVHSRKTELEYQQQLSQDLLPFLLPSDALESKSTCGLFRELLVYAVFSVGIEKITEPDFVNQILLLLLDEESMEEPLEPRSTEVEALEKFSKPLGIVPFNDLLLTIPTIINTSVLYNFIQFTKKQGCLNILQFCLDLEHFNKHCVVPDLTEPDKKQILQEVKSIYKKYFVKGTADFIPFDEEIAVALEKVIGSPLDQMTIIEMVTPLYRSHDYVFDLLEHKYLPLFHQSDEYLKVMFGGRDSDKPNSKPAQRAHKRKPEQIGKKFVSTLKEMLPKTQEDSLLNYDLDPYDIIPDLPDIVESHVELVESIDIDLEDVRDMSKWVINIPKVAFCRNGSKEIVSYVISVCESESNKNIERWDVKRKHHEFYVLHNKLREFHGIFGGGGLPTKRNSTLSSKHDSEIFEKYQNSFRQYLQDLVRNPLTRGSALLFNFLSPDAEFSKMFTPDTVGQVAGKKLKSVATLLKKEKGKNLDTFLHSFLASTKPPSERGSPISGSPCPQRKDFPAKNQPILKKIVDINGDIKAHNSTTRGGGEINSLKTKNENEKEKPQLQLKGVTEYILYLAIHLFDVPCWFLNILLCLRIVGQKTFDHFVERYLAYKIELALHEYHFVPIIHLFRDTVFFDDDPPRTDTQKVERRNAALKKLLSFFPELVGKLIGQDKYKAGLATVFELLQHPQLNKQLAYTLLDTVVTEVFPEINEVHS